MAAGISDALWSVTDMAEMIDATLPKPGQRGPYKRPGGVMMWRRLQALGLTCLAIVVLTHVAERWHILSGMGWGLPHSPGHYLDLASAVLGCLSLTVGLAGWAIVGRKNSN